MHLTSNPRLLIVAGHDPSGGAGVDADRESVSDLPIEPLIAVTAFTEQDAHSVRAIGARDPDEWLNEGLVLSQRGVQSVKFGLLPGEDHVRAAAQLVRIVRELSAAQCPIVVDPVIASSSGKRFMDDEAIHALLHDLVLIGVVLTPNIAEAAQLARMPLDELVHDPERRIDAARELLSFGASAVILKGGHGVEDPVRDLTATRDGAITWHEHARVQGGKIRGSGCRFATRLAAGLALGRSLEESAHEAGNYVARLIREQRKR